MILTAAAAARIPPPLGRRRAQSASVSLQGHVVDPTGASVARAQVALIDAGGSVHQGMTNAQGSFSFSGLSAGSVQLVVTAPGFSAFRRSVTLTAINPPTLQIHLNLATARQEVSVEGGADTLSLQPADRAAAVTLTGKALQSLSSDPDQLQTDLQALAGPGIGGAGGTIYVNGFTRGETPPKSAIQSVEVNNNPFGARFAKFGSGRIEIQTKPGSASLHGDFSYDGNSNALNSLNPFLAAAGGPPPQYRSDLFSADLSGSRGKSLSWFLAVERRNINNVSVVNAQILAPSLAPEGFVTSLLNPNRRTAATPQFDFQLTRANTLTARYEFLEWSESGDGVGGQSLPSQAMSRTYHGHNLQIGDTQILSPDAVNQLRYQFEHHGENDNSVNSTPTLSVLGAFTGGGNARGTYGNWETHNDLREDLSVTYGAHQLGLGGEVNANSKTEFNGANYNGAFVFTSLADYQATQSGLGQGLPMAQIQAAGDGPSQFTRTVGVPRAHINLLQASLYVQDTWQLRPNLTAAYGLRFETENMQHDHADWAPRLGVAWGLGGGKAPQTVLRAGFGLFYDRLGDNQMMVVAHSRTADQRQYVINLPSFYPNLPSAASLAALPASYPTTSTYAPNLRAPLTATTALSLEHQFGPLASFSLDFIHSDGSRQLLTNDINAPLPGTYNPSVPGSGVRPFGAARGNIDAYQSVGIFRQNQLVLNFKLHPGAVALSGYYTLNDAHSDSNGADSFPTNPWNLLADYGRAGYDIRHRFYVSGSVSLPWGITANPFLVAESGRPFSITLGEDLYGTGQQNARPALAGPSTPAADLVQTPYGAFNLAPANTAAIIPPNTATGPPAFALNLRLSKTFGFGPGAAPGADRRYRLNLGVSARNLLNTVNLAAPVGNLNSPRFGQSIGLNGGEYSSGVANRRIDLSANLSF
ncbi:MAG TPA: TonB-dependent receptor [Terriglobales bacterium]|nr:TonB-dependent receptor [Terriglobales bacterium]